MTAPTRLWVGVSDMLPRLAQVIAAAGWRRMNIIRTPAEANATPARTILLDTCEDVWQHNIEPATLWEDRIDYWTTPGDEEGHDANEPTYPARIIHQPEEQTDE